ncbi:lipoyl(octanoyl) transferase LipB, partial [Mycolicibacterium porcinum]|uniref:lipoyl(octanoyl) transferase LipB n=1 Tax=Mycolicibacterium porcinum TaxID=39693 RepID=UPI0009F2A45D
MTSIRSAATAPLEVRRLGTLDYAAAWDLQREIADARVAGGPDTLLLLQHPAVYTAGKRTEPHERPLDGTPVVDTDRGGKITWHGPGQLVGYPIIGLAEPLDVVNFVRRLEQALISVCADLGLETGRVEGRSGVWVAGDGLRPARKVGAIGIRVSRATTLHGFASNRHLNVRSPRSRSTGYSQRPRSPMRCSP